MRYPGIGPRMDASRCDLPQGWLRQIADASPRRPVQPRKGCTGHFFSLEAGNVTLDMGEVTCRPVYAFRAASSLLVDDEPKNILSWVEEGAAPNAEYLNEARGFRSGSVVIPGQTLTGESFAQKTGGQSAMGGIKC